MAANAIRKAHPDDPDQIRCYLSSVRRVLALAPVANIADAVEICDGVRLSGGTVYLCGNGGSAATASHAACDLAKLAHVEGQKRLRVTTLVDNAALLSAYGNDDGYANIFKHQILSILSVHDALIGISVSGASENVLRAMEYASSIGVRTIGLSGSGTERMRRAASLMIETPGESVQAAEDTHMVILHALSMALRARQHFICTPR